MIQFALQVIITLILITVLFVTLDTSKINLEHVYQLHHLLLKLANILAINLIQNAYPAMDSQYLIKSFKIVKNMTPP